MLSFKFPKAWIAINTLVNSGMLILVIFCNSLLAIYGASLLILLALAIEFVVTVLEYRMKSLENKLKIAAGGNSCSLQSLDNENK